MYLGHRRHTDSLIITIITVELYRLKCHIKLPLLDNITNSGIKVSMP